MKKIKLKINKPVYLGLPKAFLKILQMMLKKDKIHEMKLIDNYQKESIKKIIKQFVAIRPKT